MYWEHWFYIKRKDAWHTAGAVWDTIRGNPGAFPDKAGQRTPEGYLEGTFFAQMGELSTGGSDTGVDFANANPFAVLFHRRV